MGIERVLICGLGAVGLTYAGKLNDVCELKILADKARIKKYELNPPKLNDENINLRYILPDERWNPDLIIISTKYSGLDTALDYIKNFVGENTTIISLLNGITSEKIISEKYGKEKVLHSYFIGHSAIRENSNVMQDGIGKIVFGSPYSENQNRVSELESFFKSKNIDYEVPNDIIYSMWLKFALNIFSNQPSAIMNLTFGEMKQNKNFKEFAKKILKEIKLTAEKEGISNADNLEKDSLKALMKMVDCGKTSMLQDIEAGRKTEVDIFSGEIIKLGQLYNIPTPYNQVVYDMVKIIEERVSR